MKSLMLFSILSLGSLVSQMAFADEGSDEHPMSTILGEQIDLKTRGHGFAGSIRDYLVLGNFDHDVGVSTLTILQDNRSIVTKFEKVNNVLGGEISLALGDTFLKTKIEFVKVLADTQQLIFKLNGNEIVVSIKGDEFESNHFTNPTFSTTLGEAPFQFTLKGKASYGYGAHLSMMIIAAHSFGEHHIFTSYQDLASALAEYTKMPTANLKVVAQATEELISNGLMVMQRYAKANPVCAAQYDVIYGEVEAMKTMSVDDLHTKYHNGTGLPAASKHCYFGRSLIVHPMMNLVRLNEGLTDAERADAVEEFEEVASHIVRAKKNIDSPPSP